MSHIFPTTEAIVRLVCSILLEQNDEWAVQRARYMTLETMAAFSDDPVVGLPAMSSDRPGPKPDIAGSAAELHQAWGHDRQP